MGRVDHDVSLVVCIHVTRNHSSWNSTNRLHRLPQKLKLSSEPGHRNCRLLQLCWSRISSPARTKSISAHNSHCPLLPLKADFERYFSTRYTQEVREDFILYVFCYDQTPATNYTSGVALSEKVWTALQASLPSLAHRLSLHYRNYAVLYVEVKCQCE